MGEALESSPNLGCLCQDCGKTFVVDILVPDDLWSKIKPEGKGHGAGLLCGPCIMRRIEEKTSGFGAYWLTNHPVAK
jgi:hypothetical protein